MKKHSILTVLCRTLIVLWAMRINIDIGLHIFLDASKAFGRILSRLTTIALC